MEVLEVLAEKWSGRPGAKQFCMGQIRHGNIDHLAVLWL